MATRSVTVRSYIGPLVEAPHAFVDVAPAYRIVDGVAINWPDEVTYEIVSGVVTIDEMQDTYDGEPLVWSFTFRNMDRRNVDPISPPRRELVTFEGTSGATVEYVNMHQVEVAVPPQYGPTYLALTKEYYDEIAQIDANSVQSGAVVGDDLILTKKDGTTVNAGEVKGAPGLPGVNAVENDDAVAGYVANPASATAEAILALTGPALVEKTGRPGTFDILNPTRIAENLERPGTFEIGEPA
jgi:hypothetical protein